MQFIGAGNDPWGGYRRGYVGTTTIKRSDFGYTENLGPAADAVNLKFVIEACARRRLRGLRGACHPGHAPAAFGGFSAPEPPRGQQRTADDQRAGERHWPAGFAAPDREQQQRRQHRRRVAQHAEQLQVAVLAAVIPRRAEREPERPEPEPADHQPPHGRRPDRGLPRPRGRAAASTATARHWPATLSVGRPAKRRFSTVA